jgi:hypothetical protein
LVNALFAAPGFVRDAALEGLVLYGESALEEVQRAARHARPDRERELLRVHDMLEARRAFNEGV